MFLFGATGFSQKNYTLDKFHARVGFTATHFGISHVIGNFKTFDATLQSNKEDFTDAVMTFSIEVNSVNTDVEYRDNDLKSQNYFDAAKFPTINFKSTSFKKIKGKEYKLAGDLTIHGVTKPVEFAATYNGTAVTFMKKPTAGFTITGKVNRLDFGVGGSPLTFGVSDEIEIISDLEFTISD